MSITILIADDEPSLRLLAKASLKNQDYNLIEATDGQQALQLIESVKPDLILLDVMMPHLTGFQVCSTIKQNPELSHIPVIILTAKGGAGDKNTAHESGANFFLTKPFRPAELLQAVQFMANKIKKISHSK